MAENSLPDTFRGDLADRLIASTALAHDLTLLTPDQKILFHRVCTTSSSADPDRPRYFNPPNQTVVEEKISAFEGAQE